MTLGLVQCVGTAGCDTSSLSDIEDLCVVLQPVQVSGQLLCDVTLASGGQANHDDDQLGAHIALCNASIRRNLGFGESGNVQGSRANARRTGA